MIRKIEKKLLEFNTKGSTTEDFYAARRAKTAKFRAVIRGCFYLHCIIAVVCIALSIVFSAGFDIIKISVCALTSVVFAFFAVGDLEHVKTISCIIDFALGTGAFVFAALGNHRTLYLICGILMIVLGLSMILSGIAAACKRLLESASPLTARTEKRFFANGGFDDIPDLPEDYIIEEIPEIPPQSAGKMRELANQVCEIICGETDEK